MSDSGHTPKVEKNIEWRITENDLKHILPTTSLIVRRKGLSHQPDASVKNVYTKDIMTIPDVVLDQNTINVGIYLTQRYACKKGMFGLSASDEPNIDSIVGPKAFLGKVKCSKGITVKRMTGKHQVFQPSERQGNGCF